MFGFHSRKREGSEELFMLTGTALTIVTGIKKGNAFT